MTPTERWKSWRDKNLEHSREYQRQYHKGEKSKQTRKRYYENNKEQYAQRGKLRRERFGLFLEGIKLYYGCTNLNCKWDGAYDAGMLDFHHINPAEKEFSVGKCHNRLPNAPDIVAEINKCCILCSNCHRLEKAGSLDCSQNTRCNLDAEGRIIGMV